MSGDTRLVPRGNNDRCDRVPVAGRAVLVMVVLAVLITAVDAAAASAATLDTRATGGNPRPGTHRD